MAITLSPTSPTENRFCPLSILPLFLTGFRGVNFDLYTHGVNVGIAKTKSMAKMVFHSILKQNIPSGS